MIRTRGRRSEKIGSFFFVLWIFYYLTIDNFDEVCYNEDIVIHRVAGNFKGPQEKRNGDEDVEAKRKEVEERE